MKKKKASPHPLRRKVAALTAELAETRETLRAIREGEVDALVVEGTEGEQIYTLHSADQPYRILIESMNEGALTLSSSGTIFYCNQWFARYIDTPSENVLGASIYDYVAKGDHTALEKLLSAATGRQQRGTVELQTGAGRALPCIFSFSPIQTDGGNAICAVVTDLTEQNRLARSQIALEQMKANNDEVRAALSARDEFLSIASHELKTPITSIKLQLQMTRRAIDADGQWVVPPEKLARVLDISMKQVDRLTVLIEDLLDVSKIQAGRLTLDRENVNLSELVEDLSARHAEELARARCAITLKLDRTLAGFWDRMRLEQVFINLLTNAIKYAPGSDLVVTVSRKGRRAVLSVQDFGSGIPKGRQAKIFDRFERAISSRKLSGLGLGLYIVKSIVEAHGGVVRVASTEGKGSLFTVEIPIQANGVETGRPLAAVAMGAHGRK